MKKRLIAAGLGLALAASAQAADKVAVLDVNNVFQQVVKNSGADKVLENEFKGRAGDLQKMEMDLQTKIKKFQKESAKMKPADRSKMEKDLTSERATFTSKAQQFEQEHAQRTNEERNKILSRIDTAVKKVAADQKIDVVLNSGTVVFKSNDVKDISSDVLKQVK